MKLSVVYIWLIIVCTLSPVVIYAETYTTLSGVPGFEAVNSASAEQGFAPFINALFNMSIGLGILVAVFVIIFSGIKHAASDSFGVKSDLKDRILMSLGGLVLLLGSYIFLTLINPDLIDFDLRGSQSLLMAVQGIYM